MVVKVPVFAIWIVTSAIPALWNIVVLLIGTKACEWIDPCPVGQSVTPMDLLLFAIHIGGVQFGLLLSLVFVFAYLKGPCLSKRIFGIILALFLPIMIMFCALVVSFLLNSLLGNQAFAEILQYQESWDLRKLLGI